MPLPHDITWRAARLIHWGLEPLARPAQDEEYRELVDSYLDDGELQAAVRQIASGLRLHVLDVSDHGIVLVPEEGSEFAFKPADFRSGSKVDDRLLDGLVQIAIATTVFPRARDLDEDPDLARPPVSVDEVELQLRRICERLREEARRKGDAEASDEEQGLAEAWRIYLRRLPAIETKDARKAMRATRRVVEYALDRLREFGCFTQIYRGTELAWQPTRRYQVMVQRFAATRLFDIVRHALEDPVSKEAS